MTDESDFVSFGTPLEPIEEDDVPKKKPIRIEDQIVTDEKGRRRFHGAFTGGFSAGYFNTVGTKEGWTPSTFVSSRSNKAASARQTALDIMDDEDRGEHGISHQAVRVTSHYGSEGKEDRKRSADPNLRKGPIPGEPPLSTLIVPSRETIGVVLLKKMGWKTGQGIGPRLKYKEKVKKSQQDAKVYGCILPQDFSSDDEDRYSGHTFAPSDTDCLPYTPKDNLHGLGYKGLDKSSLSSTHINLFEPTTTSAVMKNKSRLRISGQAFGVGAFEEDDEDIYSKDDMSRYDFMLGSEKVQDKKKSLTSADTRSPQSIEGFYVASKKQTQLKIFPAPAIPKTFKPVHVCQTHTPTNKGLDRHSLSVAERSHLIGEKKKTESVFDLISAEDKLKLEASKTSILSSANRFSPKETKNDSSQDLNYGNLKFAKSDFKPFKQDSEKQNRYEKFLNLMEIGKKDELHSLHPGSMTEWERDREKDEFFRAANMYRPLVGLMASRFTTAEHHDDESKIEISIDKIDDRSDEMKAAEMKMFGSMTRKKFEWHPDRVLCKRFNVPNPYPGCEIIGLPKIQKEKRSLFNFMTSDVNDPLPVDKHVSVTNNSDDVGKKGSTQLKEVNVEKKITDGSDLSLTNNQSDQGEEEESHPSIDIFKAIFASDENDSEEDSEEESVNYDDDDEKFSNNQSNENLDDVDKTKYNNSGQESANSQILSKKSSAFGTSESTKSGSGVFANIDFDALNTPTNCISSDNIIDPLRKVDKSSPNNADVISDITYGPALPPQTTKRSHNKKKKKKKSKHKSKKERKKKKSKHKKKIQNDSSSSSNSSDDESQSYSNLSDQDIAERLRRIGTCNPSVLSSQNCSQQNLGSSLLQNRKALV